MKTTNNKKPTNGKKETEKKETIYPQGIVAFYPHEKAPDFVRAEIIVNKDLFIDFINANENLLHNSEKYGEQLKLTLKQGRESLYLQVNTYGLDA